MRFRDFVKMCDRIEASIREQRPEMSKAGVEDLLMETLLMIPYDEPKARKRKAKQETD